MKRAQCMIREALVYRRAAFVAGLHAAGYVLLPSINDPDPGDVLVIWNRYGQNDELAKRFELAGARVVVVENGYMGKNWLGDRWFAMALGQHAGAGMWRVGSDERWGSLGVEIAPWRAEPEKQDVVILAQRGIGSPLVRSPPQWAEKVQKRIGGRVRAHPGKEPPKVSLEEDLREASCVVTWASSAAFQALLWGVPVFYDFVHWIGAGAAIPLSDWGKGRTAPEDPARLEMFRSLAWAMWRASEVEDGTAFRHLLGA